MQKVKVTRFKIKSGNRRTDGRRRLVTGSSINPCGAATTWYVLWVSPNMTVILCIILSQFPNSEFIVDYYARQLSVAAVVTVRPSRVHHTNFCLHAARSS